MLLILPGFGRAEWQATVNRMGFFGNLGAGAIYDWENRHSLELSIGFYSNNEKTYSQTNLAYRYSRWIVEYPDIFWSPIQLGIFSVRSWDRDGYFLRSPSKYPYAGYYDETALRWGLEFGTVVKWKSSPVALAYHVRILDAGVVAIYNNANKDLQYHVSSGLALRYCF